MNKIIKMLLVVLIVFMQLSSPVLVLADAVEDNNIIDNSNNDNSNTNSNNIVNDNNNVNDDTNVNNINSNINNVTDTNINDNSNTNSVNDNDNINDDSNNNNDNVNNNDNTNDVTNNNVVNNENTNNNTNEQDNNTIETNNNDINNNVEQNNDVKAQSKSAAPKSISFKTLLNSPTYEFDVNATVNNGKVKVDITHQYTESFIAKINVTFNHIVDDTIKNTLEVEKVVVLNNTTIELNDIGADLNGEYNLEVSIYKLEDALPNEEESTLNTYISTKTPVFTTTKNKFYTNEIDTTIELYTSGSTDIVCVSKQCTLAETATNKLVNINSTVVEGNKGITNSYVKYVVNNSLNYDSLSLNFSNLLPGTYVIQGDLYNENDEIIATDTLTIVYGNGVDNSNLAPYFADSNISTADKVISMSTLDDNQKNLVFDELVENAWTGNLSCVLEVDSANGLIISNDCYGKILETDILPLISELVQYLGNVGIGAVMYDKDNNPILTDTYIQTNMVLKVSMFGINKDYTIVVLGDIDGLLVQSSDIQLVLDYIVGDTILDQYQILAADVNEDSVVDMLDVSYMAASVFEELWLFIPSYVEEVKALLERENSNNLKVGDTFKVYLKLEGFENGYINGIEALLDFDKEGLELVEVNLNDKLKDFVKVKDNRIIGVGGDIVDEDSVVIELTFKVLKTGNYEIKLADVFGATDGFKLNLTNDTTVSVTAIEEQQSDTTSTPVATFKDEVKEPEPTPTEPSATFMNVKVYNTYLSKLEIAGYEIEFDKYKLEYYLSVDNDVDSLDITAIPEEDSSTVRIYGNSDFKVGENLVNIVVAAPDGSDRTYVIKVNKKDKDVVEKLKGQKKESETSKAEKSIIVVLIVAVAGGLLYLIFKKDE